MVQKGDSGVRVAIIGSRNCGQMNIQAILNHLPPECSCIISGGATGVDSFAQQAAAERGLCFLCFAPEYAKYGRQAPLKRNQRIVEQADMVLAFWDFASRGTAYTIVQCIRKGVPVRIIGLDECCPNTSDVCRANHSCDATAFLQDKQKKDSLK